MKLKDIRVCILRIEGTNCEDEMFRSFAGLGAKPELVHLKQLLKLDVSRSEMRTLTDYQILMFPGGFSSGDYIRAGAILAARIKAKLGDELVAFANDGYAIGGVCNGFQILIELGMLPGFGGIMSERPEAALAVNDSGRFECRPALLKFVNRGNCAFSRDIERDKILVMPCAHAEGKFVVDEKRQSKLLKQLEDNDQIVFKYVDGSGNDMAGYPYNPNGSLMNIAGICNPSGNIFGLMPHPERVFYRITHPDWYRERAKFKLDAMTESAQFGDGMLVFKSVLDYIADKF